MPTYEYQCNACKHRFEELQSFSEPDLTATRYYVPPQRS